MLSAEPFADEREMLGTASEIWSKLTAEDWRDAFRAHPKIGERKATSEWSSQEQSAAATADQSQSNDLERLNREYEQRYGYIFIICATGKSADEILEALRRRLLHHPEEEIRIAAGEQLQITHLRLKRLMAESR